MSHYSFFKIIGTANISFFIRTCQQIYLIHYSLRLFYGGLRLAVAKPNPAFVPICRNFGEAKAEGTGLEPVPPLRENGFRNHRFGPLSQPSVARSVRLELTVVRSAI